jgi:hypothetical protein
MWNKIAFLVTGFIIILVILCGALLMSLEMVLHALEWSHWILTKLQKHIITPIKVVADTGFMFVLSIMILGAIGGYLAAGKSGCVACALLFGFCAVVMEICTKNTNNVILPSTSQSPKLDWHYKSNVTSNNSEIYPIVVSHNMNYAQDWKSNGGDWSIDFAPREDEMRKVRQH